jgi:hypothetical protein
MNVATTRHRAKIQGGRALLAYGSVGVALTNRDYPFCYAADLLPVPTVSLPLSTAYPSFSCEYYSDPSNKTRFPLRRSHNECVRLWVKGDPVGSHRDLNIPDRHIGPDNLLDIILAIKLRR